MKGLNKLMLIGRVGKDPETSVTKNGHQLAKFSLAVSKKVNGQDVTTWFDIDAWSKTAEIVGQYVRKGSTLFVEGEIQTRTYQDKEGNKRSAWSVVARDVVLLGDKKQEGQVGHGSFETQPLNVFAAPALADSPFTEDEDIPF